MTRRSLASIAALFLAVAMPAMAQQPPAAPGQPARPGAPGRMAALQGLNVELAMRMKEQLKLTDSQVSQLDAIRKEIVAERQTRAHDMIDVQSRIAAGLIKPEDVRKQLEANRESVRQVAQQRHDRITKILTSEQLDQLRQAERRMMMRRMRMGRAGFGQGFGAGFGPQRRPGWGRQFGPGMGQGFVPGMRPRRPFPPRGPGFGEN